MWACISSGVRPWGCVSGWCWWVVLVDGEQGVGERGVRWVMRLVTYLILGTLVIRGHHLLREVNAHALRGIRRKGLDPVSPRPLTPRRQRHQHGPRPGPRGTIQTHPRKQPRPASVIQEPDALGPLVVVVLDPVRADEGPARLDALYELRDCLFILAVVVRREGTFRLLAACRDSPMERRLWDSPG